MNYVLGARLSSLRKPLSVHCVKDAIDFYLVIT